MAGFDSNGGLDQRAAAAWQEFGDALAGYLATMTDEEDHLLVETPEGDGESGATPYAQFCVAGDGRIRAEVPGNGVLAAPFRLTDDLVEVLVDDLGWTPPEDDGCPNFAMTAGRDETGGLALRVREVLEDFFGVPHPSLLSAHAWGPASDGVAALGIPTSDDVATDIVDTDEVPSVEPSDEPGVTMPRDQEHLIGLVRRFLTGFLGHEPIQDDDEDFVIPHDGVPVYVKVRAEEPVIDVFTRLVHDVRPRQAAVEVALLNRDRRMVKFLLHDREVYQLVSLPAMPFVPAHLRYVLPGFLAMIDDVRVDLAVRANGEPA
jgi:hypothetical protein